jgi:hypothetical protein
MKPVLRWRVLVQTAMVFSLLLCACATKTQGPDATSPAAEQSLKRFLQTLDDSKTTRYIAAFRDLNNDGKPEAIVYLLGSNWCGSGGCNTIILAHDDNSWRVVTNISLTRPPIRLLASTSHGWSNLGVWVQGGGTQPGYEAELLFDGKSYPKNPSVAPAQRLMEKADGEVIISSVQGAKLLNDDKATAVPAGPPQI